MRLFRITFLHEGQLETFDVWTTNARSAKRYIENHWRENLLFETRVIRVDEIKEPDCE